MTEIIKTPLKTPNKVTIVGYMSMDAITALIAMPDVSKPKGLRNKFFMILLYDTGSRIEEMLNLKLSDFRYGKIGTVLLIEQTIEHLRRCLEIFHIDSKNDAFWFYSEIHGQINPLNLDSVCKFLRKITKKMS